MIRIAICDDEKEFVQQLTQYILNASKTFNEQFEIDGYTDSRVLTESLKEEKYDMIFLDIQMPYIDGLAIGKYIRNNLDDNVTEIVYISSERKYAMDLFSVRPMNFIIKPVSENDIFDMLQLGLKLVKNSSQLFDYELKGETHRVKLSDIYYFKSDARKIIMIMSNGTEISFYGKMSELAEKVTKYNFKYIHKSYIINSIHVKHFTARKVIMNNGHELPVSRTNRENIKHYE